MLNYNSPINNQINFNEITVKELSPVMKLNLRGKKREFFTTVGKQLEHDFAYRSKYIFIKF